MTSKDDRGDSARIEAEEARAAALTELSRSGKDLATPECEPLYALARRFFVMAEQRYAAGDFEAGYFYWEQGHRYLVDALVCEGIPVI